MKVIKAYFRTWDQLVDLEFAANWKVLVAPPPGGFFPPRFVKEVFLSAASQANRKESNGNTD